MEHLYIDESGSMTAEYIDQNPCFIIAVVRAKEPKRLQVLHKRFVHKHMEELRAADREGRMFRDGKFLELKGSMFTPQLKREFVSFFCREPTLEVLPILIDNQAVSGDLYANTARAFNYVLKLALGYWIRKGMLSNDSYHIQLDERNERTETKLFLQNYLNTELRMSKTVAHDIQVQYFDSSQNRNIQVADVFANLFYSQAITKKYDDVFDQMRRSGCLESYFLFPPK